MKKDSQNIGIFSFTDIDKSLKKLYNFVVTKNVKNK